MTVSIVPDQPAFDIVLHPNRSLGRNGFVILMLAFGMVCFVAGVVFVVAGAWPVLPFLGLDVLIIYAAFKLNERSLKRYETVRLTRTALELRRITPGKAEQAWSFEPYWARAVLDQDQRLHLTSHGKRVEFGTFLIPEEKASLRDALNSALRTQRLGV